MICETCNGTAQTRFVDRSNGRLCWEPCTDCRAGKLRDIQIQLIRAKRDLQRASIAVKKHLRTIDTLRELKIGIQLSKDK